MYRLSTVPAQTWLCLISLTPGGSWVQEWVKNSGARTTLADLIKLYPEYVHVPAICLRGSYPVQDLLPIETKVSLQVFANGLEKR